MRGVASFTCDMSAGLAIMSALNAANRSSGVACEYSLSEAHSIAKPRFKHAVCEAGGQVKFPISLRVIAINTLE